MISAGKMAMSGMLRPRCSKGIFPVFFSLAVTAILCLQPSPVPGAAEPATAPSAGWIAGAVHDPAGKTAFVAVEKDIEIWNVENGTLVNTLHGHKEPVQALAVSPDGKLLLSGAGHVESQGTRSMDNSARLWDIATGNELKRFDGATALTDVVMFSPDKEHVLTVAHDRKVRIWDQHTGDVTLTLPYVIPGVTRFGASGVQFGHDGRTILGLSVGGASVWDASTGKELRRIDAGGRGFISAELAEGDKLVVTASSDKHICLWDATAGELVRELTGHTGYVDDVAFNHDGTKVIAGCSDGSIRLWNAQNGDEVRKIVYDNPQTPHVILSPDDRFIFGMTKTGGAFWAVDTGRQLTRMEDVNFAVFTADGSKLLTVARTKANGLCLWDARTGEKIREFR